MIQDVVIVGGGPNGLMLAAELCLGGVHPIVLERLEAPSSEPKANGLVGQVVRTMDYRGLYRPLAAAAAAAGGSPSRRLLLRLRAGRAPKPTSRFTFGGFTLDLRRMKDNPLLVLLARQGQLEQVLARHATGLGAEIRRGHTVTGLEQDDDGVTVEVDGVDGPYQLRTRYLAGCDGGHSTVRRLAGIDFPGVTSQNLVSRNAHVVLPRSMVVRGELRLSNGRRYAPFVFHRTDHGAFSFASLDPGLHIVTSHEWTRTDSREDQATEDVAMTVTELRESVSRVLGQDIAMSPPTKPGHYILRRNTSRNTRLAERYRSGRIFVAGDAAHVHFGLGGLGLNLGLQDVVNLGWKLAAELTGWAPPGLLETYDTERRPFAERVTEHTQVQAKLLSCGAEVDAARDEFRDYLAVPANLRAIADTIAGTDLTYDMGAETPPHPLLGRLAPDLALRTTDGLKTVDGRTRIAELMRAARPVLIDLTPDRGLTQPPGRLRVLNARCPDRPGLAGLLLRPDGYVAWAADRDVPVGMLQQGLRTALARWIQP